MDYVENSSVSNTDQSLPPKEVCSGIIRLDTELGIVSLDETAGHLQWSVTGCKADFARGANRSRGGKAFIATASTAKNGTVSCIVPTLAPAASVTTSKNDVDHVVTEFGVARLRGQIVRKRALNLIHVAHPDFRGELMAEARRMNRT